MSVCVCVRSLHSKGKLKVGLYLFILLLLLEEEEEEEETKWKWRESSSRGPKEQGTSQTSAQHVAHNRLGGQGEGLSSPASIIKETFS